MQLILENYILACFFFFFCLLKLIPNVKKLHLEQGYWVAVRLTCGNACDMERQAHNMTRSQRDDRRMVERGNEWEQ
jgi:hypothetical protein